MEGLTIEMTVRLRKNNYTNKLFLESALMPYTEVYCDAVWIDDEPIVLDGHFERETQVPIHRFKYQFKNGKKEIPQDAFTNLDILDISFSEGWLKLKNNCFYSSSFLGNLILPDSIQRICSGALEGVKVCGEFHFPANLKCLSSLPENLVSKNEIVLPEGLHTFTYPGSLKVNNLYLPSTLKEIRINRDVVRFGPDNNIKCVTISPDNLFLSLKNNEVVSILRDKRRKLNKIESTKMLIYMDNVFVNAGLTYNCNWSPPSLSIPVHSNHSVEFIKKDWGSISGIKKVSDIALQVKTLFSEYDSLCTLMHFDRAFEALQQKPSLLEKKTSHRTILHQMNGYHEMFTLNLSGIYYPIVYEAEEFLTKWILLMKELCAKYGPFRMVVK